MYHGYMNRQKVLLLFGGESSEHEVSIMSARNVYEAIDAVKFDVLLGYIDKLGRWFALEKFDDYKSPEKLASLSPQLGGASFQVGDEMLSPDVILPILHGKNGEDGSVQGLAQLLHIPIVGCDMTASAAGMDKIIAKRVAESIGVSVVPYLVYRRGDEAPEYDALCAELSDTLFVKPSRAGSSVGVSKVHSEQELADALRLALESDDTVLIEQALDVRELEVAVLGDSADCRVSVVGEILPSAEFYSYEDKYDSESSSSVQIPADIGEADRDTIRTQAEMLYRELGCKGLSRIDFFLTLQGDVYFNEINTLPGFTNISMYPKLWQYEGVSYTDLITRLLESTLEPKT